MSNREMRLLKKALSEREAQPRIGPDVVEQIFMAGLTTGRGEIETRTYVRIATGASVGRPRRLHNDSANEFGEVRPVKGGKLVEHLKSYEADRILESLFREAMEDE
jgi:hypothetical protein